MAPVGAGGGGVTARAAVAAAALGLLLSACDGAGPATGTATTATATSAAATPTTTTVTASPATTTHQATTTTAAATTTPTATTTAALPDPIGGWERIPVDPAVFGDATLTDGATGGGRLVVGGCPATGAQTGGFPLWWSDGGEQWQRADGPPGAACIVQVAASPFGFFADDRAGRAFRSADGRTWAPLTEAGLGFAEGELGVVFAIFVAPAGDRVTLLYSRASVGESRVATLITTTDGETWVTGPAASAGLFDSSDVAAVVPGEPGLLAAGASPGGEFVPTAAVFASADGLTWERVTGGGADFDDKVIRDVLAVDGGFVAVGGDFFTTGLMTAWTSADGRAWRRSPHPPEETDPAVAHMTAEAATVAGGRIWAAGHDFDARRGDAPDLPALWVSDDGVGWERADPAAARSRIPFELLRAAELRIGTWPPPFSGEAGPVQLFRNGP